MANETINTENLNQEQIDNLKESIIKQIKDNSNFSQEQKNQFIEKINSLDNEGFIQFLKKQGIINEEGSSQQESQTTQSPAHSQENQKCIFCSIVFGDTPSWKVAENEKAIAVLEINPLSKGHTLIIPKEHIISKENIPEEAKNLSMTVSEKIKKELSPKEVRFESKNLFGHEILNLIPLYENQDPNKLEQKQASNEELKEIHEKISISQEEGTEEKEKEEEEESNEEKEEEINEENTWLPKRIP